MIKEKSRFRILWDSVILLLIPISCILIPLTTVFQIGGNNFFFLLYLIDFVFILDIGLNFFTSKSDAGREKTKPKNAALNYLKTTFFIDLIASFPIIYGADVDSVLFLQIFPVFRLLRLIRLFAILKRLDAYFWNYTAYIRIVKFLLIMAVVIHWIASAWFLLARMDGFSEMSWIIASGFQRSDAISDYIYSLYWTIITMTTVGYGDITPVRNIEFIFTMGTALIGASSYAFIIGNLASILSSLNAAKTSYYKKVQTINNYLFQRNVPSDLNHKVREYYDHLWSKYNEHGEDQFFEELPTHLRIDILKHLANDFIDAIPLFKSSSEALKGALLIALKHQSYPPGYKVIQEGEPGGELYFVASGKLKVQTANNSFQGAYGTGDYFGEMSLVLKERRTASVITGTYCEIYCLSNESYIQLKNTFPEFEEIIKSMSKINFEKRSEFILNQIIL